MNVLELKAADSASTASICFDRGFNCFSFRADVDGRIIDVIDSQPGFEAGEGRESGNGIPLLFPYPNRIRASRYSWAGRDYELLNNLVSYDNTGNAIHGFCLDRPWRVVESGPGFAIGEFHLSRDAPDRQDLWPADFVIRCRYEVLGSNLLSRGDLAHTPISNYHCLPTRTLTSACSSLPQRRSTS